MKKYKMNSKFYGRLKRYLKRVWIFFVALIVFAAIVLTVFRALTPWASRHKADVEGHLSKLFGTSVSIQQMKTSWYWFQPVLKLDNLTISDKQLPVFNVKELLVGIDLFRSFWHWRIQPGVLFVEDATLSLRQDNSNWQLDGVSLNADLSSVSKTEYGTVLDWLLAHQKIVMKQVKTDLYWKDGHVTSIKPLNLVASNRDGHYRVKGHASLAGKSPAMISLLADLNMPSGFSSNVHGQVYLSAENINFSEWQPFFPSVDVSLTKGLGELQLWLDIRNARVVSAQSVWHLRDIFWRFLTDKKPRKIDRLSANMAWEITAKGWQLTADHVRLKANNTTWPENELALVYYTDTNQHKLFIKTLLLRPTLTLLANSPLPFKAWFDLKPEGRLQQTQFGFHAGQLHYVLSRFKNLSWQRNKNMPAVTHLSGAVAWEPHEGHLELDSQAVTLNFRQKPPLQIESLNASVLWKALNQGWRIDLDEAIVQHAHGLLSARGVLDGFLSDSGGHVHGNVSFATHDATYWWQYLPNQGIKPKLKTWLQKDVTRIDQLSGHLHLDGALKDFPFDQAPGDFWVTGSMTGVDLRFNPDWPLVKDISATLRLNQRELSADISAADFQGIPMQKANLTVRDLGLNQEVLSVKGIIQAPLEAMQQYIVHTPLHAKLSKLDALQLKAPAQLTLAIDFPFYPSETQSLKVSGAIDFKENQLVLKFVPPSFGLKALTGLLKFNEQGMQDSMLEARFLDEPMKLQIVPHQGYLAVDMQGYLSALGLREAKLSPALSLIRGRTPMKAALTITDDVKRFDHLQVVSSLEGLEIDLPQPFGKQRTETVAFLADTDFNLARGVRLKMNYENRLSTDLWFVGGSSGLKLSRGEVVLGEGKAILSDKPGASIRGSFDRFEWTPWATVFDKLSSSQTQPGSNMLQGFEAISLRFATAELFKQQYHHLELNAAYLPDNRWSVTMKEDAVNADLIYAPTQHTLSGYLSKWQYEPDTTQEKQVFHPKDIPNLDLTVGALQIGEIDAGQLMLKGRRINHNLWHLDAAELKAKPYRLTMAGEWQAAPKAFTKIDARLRVKRLEKALTHWHIDSVVESREGDMELNGGWDGGPQDFSMKAFTGKMHLTFKEGRIPNLSADTEKKMALGKVLSILSLQTIPRRLKLDFSDLAKPGYSFDKFDGYFVLAHGIMETEDSAIDGPVARATIKGSLNLDKKLYDLSLHVMPHITASLPVVATIAGGPVAGIATWVANKIINQGMEKISGYTYDVSGPWDEPVVQQVHIYKKPKNVH